MTKKPQILGDKVRMIFVYLFYITLMISVLIIAFFISLTIPPGY